jgi:hypothetical protein
MNSYRNELPGTASAVAFLGLVLSAASAFAAAPALPADCSTAAFPAGVAHGELAGKPFAPKTVTLQKSGSMTTGGRRFDTWTLQFLLPAGSSPAGRTLRRVPGGTDKQPAAASGLPEVQGWDFSDFASDVDIDSNDADGGSLRVMFGKADGKNLPGQIYLCAPADKKSRLAGSFTADTAQ